MIISRGGGDFTSVTGVDASETTATAAGIVAPLTAVVASGEVTGIIDHDIYTIKPNGALMNVFEAMALIDQVNSSGTGGIVFTGDIADFPTVSEEIVFIADVTASLTGNIFGLQSGLVKISIIDQTAIIGDFATIDCPSEWVDFRGCSLLAGVLSPKATTSTIGLTETNMSPSDIDATLIALAAITTVEGGSLGVPLGRTSASDAAIATLTGLSWEIIQGVD